MNTDRTPDGTEGTYEFGPQDYKSSATETKPFDRMALVKARYHAQQMVESLVVAYWIDGTPDDFGYHKKAAVTSYNTLTQIMREAGMIP